MTSQITVMMDTTSDSHMPPIYLGHSYGIWEHLLPNQNFSQALTAGLPVFRLQAGGCRRWKFQFLSEYHLRTQSTAGRRVGPSLIFAVVMVEIAQFDLYSRKFEYVGDPSQLRRGPTGKKSPAVVSYNRGLRRRRSAGYEN